MDAMTIIRSAPPLHRIGEDIVADLRIDNDTVDFLESHLVKGMDTLETGAGLSTLVFGVKETVHVCIVPDFQLVERIKAYATQQSVSLATVEFIIDRSERALPLLSTVEIDVVLIDGRHAFPTPWIDWFYTATLLRHGGIMIIDDMRIWTCSLLVDFMDSEPAWRVVQRTPRMAVVEKCAAVDHTQNCFQQSFVRRRSRESSWRAKIEYVFGLMARRRWSLLNQHITQFTLGRRHIR